MATVTPEGLFKCRRCGHEWAPPYDKNDIDSQLKRKDIRHPPFEWEPCPVCKSESWDKPKEQSEEKSV
ncbi:MAG TPA: hypothetical protein VI934_04015 [Candidatus Nanoarchaeia archaeon]|nr:hypothetical protein [Candidatus Nanoarchaeia archaeon]